MGMGGTQRASKFAKYLPHFGWEPLVVTVKDVHYYAHDPSLLDELDRIRIHRTESLDPLRLFARFKKRPQDSAIRPARGVLAWLNDILSSWILIPDSKILWLPFAIYTGYRLIKKNRIRVIYTSSPPQSIHLGGLILSMLTPVRWVADFRDAWTGGESQPSPSIFHSAVNRLLEKVVLKRADHVIGMCDRLTEDLRFRCGETRLKFTTIMNGYDPDDFQTAINVKLNEKFTIVHSGSVSRVSHPEPFLAALRMLFDEKPELEERIDVVFYGIDIFGLLSQSMEKYQLSERLAPIQYLPHSAALEKIMSSHLLLITIVKKTREEVISGKIFEYVGSGKPILLIISEEGFVSKLIRNLRLGSVIKYNDIASIKDAIFKRYSMFLEGKISFQQPLSLKQFDRKNLTGQLAAVFEKVLSF